MAEVIWTEPALAQLESIVQFIALDKPDVAEAVAQRIFRTTDHLETFLKLGRRIPEFPHKYFREVWVKPCWLYYRIEGKVAVILHVRRGEQLLRIDDLRE
jgi:plasmid stabilization system protein ParE